MSDQPFIPIYNPRPQYEQLRAPLEETALRVLASGGYVLGPEVQGLEEEVADFLGVEHAIGCNSGTDALIIALAALGIGPGDEVITSPFTFFASSESVDLVGARPVFAEIHPATFNITAETIEAVITERTRAIIPVHLYGQGPDTAAINALAEKHGLKVLEDVAQAFGARQGDRRLGSLGDIAAHSFYPTKNLGAAGDAGMITTNDAELAERCRLLRVHGSTRRDHHTAIGYNSRLDALQAALLRVKLPHLDDWNAGRQAAAARYNELLAPLPEVTPPLVSPHGDHVFHQYTIRVPAERRDAIRQHMNDLGVGANSYYSAPLHTQPVYRDKGYTVSLPEAERAAREVISLPMWPAIDRDTQVRVVDALKEALSKA